MGRRRRRDGSGGGRGGRGSGGGGGCENFPFQICKLIFGYSSTKKVQRGSLKTERV